MRKNMRKKGSSFVMVVIMTALIFTTATAMIALVTTDYKNRITQSRRLENMYGTDAEVDVVYNSIVKNCDAAIAFANYDVKTQIDNGSLLTYKDSPEDIYKKTNNAFKKAFIEFLYSPTSPIDVNNPNGISNTKNRLAYGIIKKQYVDPNYSASDQERDNIESLVAYPWKVDPIQGTKGAKQNAEFKIKECPLPVIDEPNGKYEISVAISSTFTSTGNVDDMTNKRTVSMKFRINAPDYNQKMANGTVQVETASYPIEKALVTDNNLNVNKGTTTVNGPIWVKGNDDSISYSGTSYSYDKYKAGIFVNNASTLNVNNGDVYTANTLNIQKNSNVTVDQDVYALNAYIGPKSDSDSDIEAETVGTNNSFTVNNDLVTNNDLAMNSKKSKATIKNFYGINDKRIADTDIIIDAESKKNSSRNSSSIIVNEYAGSTLEFKENVFVEGVAYIETDESYQTGESVGVRGNYKAYSDVLPSGEKVSFKEYNPLTLVENKADGSKMTADDKANYFKEFFADPNNKSILLDGGIQFDNINSVFTVGAYVYKDDKGNSRADRSGVAPDEAYVLVKQRQSNFAEHVFAMDDLAYANKSVDNLYIENNVVNTVEKLVDFSKASYIPSDASDIKLDFTESYGKLFYNTDETKEITITKDFIEIDGKKIDSKIKNKVDSNGNPDTNQYALIVTKGKVNIIGGDVNFKGCIIAVGDINIDGDGTKNITYDSEAVKQIKAKYSGVTDIKSIFKGTPTINDPKTTVGTKISSSTIQNEPYDAASYLQKGLWRLEK